MKRIHGIIAAVAAATALSCADPFPSGSDVDPPSGAVVDLPSGVVVTNAVPGRNSGNALGVAATAASTAYVSASPGTLVDGISVSLRNLTQGLGEVTAPVVNGGFDPVGITAEAGDELSVTLKYVSHETTLTRLTVPPRRPPRVVRTSPSTGRTDVALNVQIEIIFTEPVDKSTITNSSIGLQRDGRAVNGTITVSGDALSAVFVPDASLEPKATYAFLVSTAVRDLDGDALGEPVNVEFTTVDQNVPENAVASGTVAFVSERDGNLEVYVGQADGTDVVRLTDNPAADFAPAWSPDGKRIAFVSNREGGPAIYVMNSDGSAVSRVTNSTTEFRASKNSTLAPTWSPDGQMIVFAADRVTPCSPGQPACQETIQSGLYAVRLDGSWDDAVRIGPDDVRMALRDPAWSPDGQQLAFARGSGDEMGSVIMAIKPDGTNLVGLAGNGGLFWNEVKPYSQPAWSPKGDALVFVSCSLTSREMLFCSAGTIQVLKIDNNGRAKGAPSTFISGSGNAHPAWSPDGEFVAFSAISCNTCAPSIHYVSAMGAQVEGVIANGHSPAWKPQ